MMGGGRRVGFTFYVDYDLAHGDGMAESKWKKFVAKVQTCITNKLAPVLTLQTLNTITDAASRVVPSNQMSGKAKNIQTNTSVDRNLRALAL